MDFRVKMQPNGRKNIFTDKQTRNKVPLMFFYGNLLGNVTIVLLGSVNKQTT